MADTVVTKKVTDLTESTAPSDEDLFVAGSAGTASLRKIKWSNIWNKILTLITDNIIVNNLVTTVSGKALDARQGKALDDKIAELNTNNVSNISLLNGATGNLYLQKVGKLIYITGDIVLPDSYNTDASFLLAQIPYKPASLNCFFDAHRGYSSVTGSSCRGTISTDGNIYLYCPAGSIGNVRFSTVFFIA